MKVLIDSIVYSFPLVFLMTAFVLIIYRNNKLKDAQIGYVIAAIACALILSVQDGLEKWAAQDSNRIYWRIFFSYLGYVIRPASLLFLLFVVETNLRKRLLLWIPEIVNITIMAGAFSPSIGPLVFSFTNEEYLFVRGPIGYTPFVILAIYLVLFLIMTGKRRFNGRRKEAWVMFLCVFFSVLAVTLDVLFWGTNTNLAIVISSILYYLFLTSQYSGVDTLTNLLNRDSFSADSVWHPSTICAIAIFDMNGVTYSHHLRLCL